MAINTLTRLCGRMGSCYLICGVRMHGCEYSPSPASSAEFFSLTNVGGLGSSAAPATSERASRTSA